MNTLWLDDDALIELTQKKRPSAQIKVLASLRIDHRTRPDGSIVVLRSALAEHVKPKPASKSTPNMSAI